MEYVEYSKQRYDSALREIDRLKQSEFPYEHIREALLEMEKVFRLQRSTLNKITDKSTPAIAKNACSQSLSQLFLYTPILGFILRSTNVRNAFEVYSPLLRLSRQLLGNGTKLLLSSEWDYSPFVYRPDSSLKDFVLIGIPAFESSNPLLMSLAGHELGHNVWAQNDCGRQFDSQMRVQVVETIKNKFWTDFSSVYPAATPTTLTTDMYAQAAWLPAQLFAMRQLEEIFCDVMGLRLFSEAYLHAFAYLLSPSLPGERVAHYPTVSRRTEILLQSCLQLNISVPVNYVDLFDKQQDAGNKQMKLYADIADDAVSKLTDQAVAKAIEIADSKGIPARLDTNVAKAKRAFEMVMPVDCKMPLTDLLNAGWACHHNSSLWSSVEQIKSEDKSRVLYDLVLKSLEVSEYCERTGLP